MAAECHLLKTAALRWEPSSLCPTEDFDQQGFGLRVSAKLGCQDATERHLSC
jgi:hypothetical protein